MLAQRACSKMAASTIGTKALSRQIHMSTGLLIRLLVCGQGRVEALVALGETHIPAVIIEARREDQFLMSLVENIARRPPSNRDILREVRSLRERKYSVADLAKKLGMERSYISEQ